MSQERVRRRPGPTGASLGMQESLSGGIERVDRRERSSLRTSDAAGQTHHQAEPAQTAQLTDPALLGRFTVAVMEPLNLWTSDEPEAIQRGQHGQVVLGDLGDEEVEVVRSDGATAVHWAVLHHERALSDARTVLALDRRSIPPQQAIPESSATAMEWAMERFMPHPLDVVPVHVDHSRSDLGR